jgi:hypothetical protein
MADSYRARLEQGVVDTNAEAILASDRPDASNAGSAFASSTNWTTLRRPADPQLAALNLPDDVRTRIGEELSAGYVVVAPRAPVAIGAEAFTGWWRINPSTGATLGMGSSGWGQEMVEYLIILSAEGLALAFLFQYMLCKIQGNPPSTDVPRVGRNCAPTPLRERFATADLLITPVHAAMSECLKEALVAMLVTALLGGLAAGANRAVNGRNGGGSGDGPGADPFAETQADPLGKTDPALGEKGTNPTGDSAGGGPGGGKGPRPPNPPSDDLADTPEFREAVKKATAADEKFWKLLNEGADPIEIEAARQELNDAATNLALVGAAPENKQLVGKWDLWNNWPQYYNGPKAPTGANPPTPPTPTGPNGTQIIPPPASPSAPTLPGTGPGGTQIIPPAGTAPTQPVINCAGTPCVSPYEKTQTGLNGVLNTLGQKGGG